MTLGTTLASLPLALPAAAQQPPGSPLPTADYRVEWYQPHDLSGAGEWEIEVTPFGNAGATFVARADAFPVDSCWGLEVPASAPSLVRIRQASADAWSGYTAVPEPSPSPAVGLGVLCLTALGRRARDSVSNRRPREARRSTERDFARIRRVAPETKP